MNDHRRRWWGGGALFCWVVAMLIAFTPVHIDGATCDLRPVPAALTPNGSACAAKSRDRVGTLAFWVMLTAPVTVMFIVQPRPPRRRDDE